MHNTIAYIQADIRYNCYLAKDINGKSLIEHTLMNLIRNADIDKVILNLYDCEENRQLSYLQNISNKVKIRFSCIENVTVRMAQTLKEEKCELILRLAGDQFNMDYNFINMVLGEMKKENYDFFMPCYQDGITSDIVSKKAFMENLESIIKYDRYYKYFNENLTRFKILKINHNYIPWRFFVNDDFEFHVAEKIISGKKRNKDLNILFNKIFDKNGELYKSGWIRSLFEERTVDFNGNVLPWLPYSVINFIEERLKKQMVVFEYGSGNSTLWLAKNVLQVYSVEHDIEWFNKMNSMIYDNISYKYIPLEYDGEYSKEILKYTNKFDIIFIDGRDRVNCCKNCINALKNDGVIIWDDTLREEYKDGYNHLYENGFKELKLKDIGPNRITPNQTSIFYRPVNCFGI